jgi:hypothetical protein
LPREFAAAVFIVLHRSGALDLGGGPDAVVTVFGRSTPSLLYRQKMDCRFTPAQFMSRRRGRT